jgi:hypothetical protein
MMGTSGDYEASSQIWMWSGTEANEDVLVGSSQPSLYV